jgi:DNA ligase-1
MKRFALLFQRLEESNSEPARKAALIAYFRNADPRDAIWALAFLLGKNGPRILRPAQVREWLEEASNLPAWLFEESYQNVGDLAETAALLLPTAAQNQSEMELHTWMESLPSWKAESPERLHAHVLNLWAESHREERFIATKILLSAFRRIIPPRLIAEALAEIHAIPADVLTDRLSKPWSPLETSIENLTQRSHLPSNSPFPFATYLSVDAVTDAFGDIEAWMATWQFNAPRVQWVSRNNQSWLWTSDAELLSATLPDLQGYAAPWPSNFVLEGFLLPKAEPSGSRTPSPRTAETMLLVHDLLEWEGRDLRNLPYSQRFALLRQCMQSNPNPQMALAEVLPLSHGAQLEELVEQVRIKGADALLLRHRDASYPQHGVQAGGLSLKPKAFTLFAVLMYVSAGQMGSRGGGMEYTFAVRNGSGFVTVAKTKGNLEEAEQKQLDAFIKQNTLERFGPVRNLKPELVFEIAFEKVQRSARHKSGLVLQAPRMIKWHRNLSLAEVQHLDDLKALIFVDAP